MTAQSIASKFCRACRKLGHDVMGQGMEKERAMQLNEFEQITLKMISDAANNNEPCPSNLDIEMALGCSSTSVAPTVVKMLEAKGLIQVTRYQRAREVTIIATGMSTAPHPDRKTTRKHVPRGMKGRTCHTDRKGYKTR